MVLMKMVQLTENGIDVNVYNTAEEFMSDN